jgi:hypothetical protein
MTVEYRFLEEWKLVLVKISGSVTFEQMTTYLQSLSKDPRYTPPMKKLVDFRECRNYTLTREEAEKFAIFNRELSHAFPNEKCAIVAPGDLEFGMSRVHEMYISGSGLEISVFRRMSDALGWMDIDPELLE